MITYALDANIVSYFLKNSPAIVKKIHEEYSNGNRFAIPLMVYFEIQCWLVKNNSTKRMTSFEKMYSEQGVRYLGLDRGQGVGVRG